eukprot:3430357-Prymnesium_polylepis.1
MREAGPRQEGAQRAAARGSHLEVGWELRGAAAHERMVRKEGSVEQRDAEEEGVARRSGVQRRPQHEREEGAAEHECGDGGELGGAEGHAHEAHRRVPHERDRGADEHLSARAAGGGHCCRSPAWGARGTAAVTCLLCVAGARDPAPYRQRVHPERGRLVDDRGPPAKGKVEEGRHHRHAVHPLGERLRRVR